MENAYELLYAGQGQLELQVPASQSGGDIFRALDHSLRQQIGIQDIGINQSSGRVSITYDQLRWTNKSIMRTIAPQLNGNGKTHSSVPEQPGVFFCEEIIHAIRGRLRLGVAGVRGKANLTKSLALEKSLKSEPGITQVRINRTCGSVVVSYDPARWTSQAIIQHIESYRPTEQQLQKCEEDVDTEADQLLSDLQLSGTALALSLILPAPLAAPVLGLMLLRAGRTVYSRAHHSLVRQRRLTIDSLDATAVTLLMAQGSFSLAGILVTLLTAADYIRANTQEKSRKAMTEVLEHFTHQAWLVCDGQEVLVPVEKVRVGDTVAVYPGERVPVDGVVLSGRAFVDQHALTGESMPLEKKTGQPVYAATAVREGQIYLRATHIGDDTQVARIVQMIREAPIHDTRAQDYAERFANRIVPFSYLAAGISLLLGNFNQAITLLVIDYGAALRVAAPTAVLSSMTKAARHGILIRGGRHLEKLAEVDALIFDKTGTLTLGQPEVTHVIPLRPDLPGAKLLALAAAAEQRLSHPVAQAVVEAAKKRALFIPDRSDSHYVIGSGVEAMVNGRWLLVGSQRFLKNKNVHFDREAQRCLQRIEAHAVSPLCVAVDGDLIGLLGIADPIRPESKSVLQALRERGVGHMLMLTGDRPAVAREVAGSLGISDYVAEVFPDAKLDAVKRLQARGHTVAVVGDGINDSPALAQAEVGIAVNGGTAVAQEAADVVLLQGDLWKVVEAIDIAREGKAIIDQNWKLILGTNTVGLALGLAGRIGPAAASLISDGAAITAGTNAVRPMLPNGHHPVDGPASLQTGTTDDLSRPISANGKASYHGHQGVIKLLKDEPSQNGRSNGNGSSGKGPNMTLTLRSVLKGLQEPPL